MDLACLNLGILVSKRFPNINTEMLTIVESTTNEPYKAFIQSPEFAYPPIPKENHTSTTDIEIIPLAHSFASNGMIGSFGYGPRTNTLVITFHKASRFVRHEV